MSDMIRIGEGTNELKFGYSRDKVKEMFGEPDEVEQYKYEDSDKMTESWDYIDKDITLTFDEIEDWKLTLIETGNEEFQLAGKNIIGMERSELLELARDLSLGEIKFKEFSSDDIPDQELVEAEEKRDKLLVVSGESK